MKKTLITALLLFSGILLHAQINFEKGFSLQQIVEKARKENKFIFIDCYATWCIPCKMMESKVFTYPEVGQVLKDSFLAVKIQMDKTNDDNDVIKSRYSDAEEINKRYVVNSFPTYLFLSPDGKLVHRGSGFLKPNAFINLCKDALNPDKQYYNLLAAYQRGDRKANAMLNLINTSMKLGETQLSREITLSYFDYLGNQPEDTLYKKDHILFIGKFVTSSDKQVFKLFYPNGNKVDSLIGKGYSKSVLDRIIKKEIIDAMLYKKANPETPKIKTPDWNIISKTITRKYGRIYVEPSLFTSKAEWYKSHQQWELLGKLYVKTFGKNQVNPMLGLYLNEICYSEIFFHVTDKTVLNNATNWMKVIVKANPNNAAFMDTYANLLHKTGHKDEAIKVERKALELSPENQEFADILRKMERGEPTWFIKKI